MTFMNRVHRRRGRVWNVLGGRTDERLVQDVCIIFGMVGPICGEQATNGTDPPDFVFFSGCIDQVSAFRSDDLEAMLDGLILLSKGLRD